MERNRYTAKMILAMIAIALLGVFLVDSAKGYGYQPGLARGTTVGTLHPRAPSGPNVDWRQQGQGRYTPWSAPLLPRARSGVPGWSTSSAVSMHPTTRFPRVPFFECRYAAASSPYSTLARAPQAGWVCPEPWRVPVPYSAWSAPIDSHLQQQPGVQTWPASGFVGELRYW